MSNKDYQVATDTLKFLVEMNHIYTTNEECLVMKDSTNKLLIDVHKNNKKTQTGVVLFKESIPPGIDAVILNPFSDGNIESEASNWLYFHFNIMFAIKLQDAIKQLAELSLLSGDKDIEMNTDLLSYVSKYSKRVDKKFLSELNTICDNNEQKLFTVVYLKKQKKAKVVSDLFSSTAFKESFKGIRAKSWTLLSDMYCDLLKIPTTTKDDKKLDKYNVSMKNIKMPKLSAILELYGMLYESVYDIYTLLDEYNEDTGTPKLQYAIDFEQYRLYTIDTNLTECHDVAKNVQSVHVAPAQQTTNTATPQQITNTNVQKGGSKFASLGQPQPTIQVNIGTDMQPNRFTIDNPQSTANKFNINNQQNRFII